MALGSTSGVVGTVAYTQRQVIEHAFRRAGKAASAIGAEEIQFAQELIFTLLAEWINGGFPLWTKQVPGIGPGIGQTDFVTPQGTNEVLKVFWRILNPYRGPATTSAGADASALVGGQPNSDVVIAGPNPGVIVNFGTASEADQIGILLGGVAPVTAALAVLQSQDGNTFTPFQTLPSTTFQPGVWQYFDLQPTFNNVALQVQLPGANPWTLNQINVGLASFADVELGALNKDDYYNLPDRFFQSDRPNSFFQDRLLPVPIIKAWPTPNQNAFYNGYIVAVTRRYIQDPGQMSNGVEVPPRALEALQWRLAQKLIHEIPDETRNGQPSYFTLMAKQQRIDNVEKNAVKAEALFWAEERERSPIRIYPDISPYTR